MKKDKALVVLSGGQDSTTCLYFAKERYKEVHAITFNYGQRHSIEIEAARKIASLAGVASFEVYNVVGLLRSTSPLTSDAPLEKYDGFEQMNKVIGDRVELTFVPMRNTLFLTIAANAAVSRGIHDIYTGVCQEDNANYPDCTQTFIYSLEQAINYSLGEPYIQIYTPLMHLSKRETVLLAKSLPGCFDALAYSHTSYDGKYPPTDNNHSNVLRAQGFFDANEPDPLVLRAHMEGLMDLPATANYDAVRNWGK